MNTANEDAFETAICLSLADSGYLYEDGVRDNGFDPELALYPTDVFHWLETQYPDEYAKVCPATDTGIATTAKQRALLTQLSKQLSKEPKRDHTRGGSVGGLLSVLRYGFTVLSDTHGKVTFPGMAEFPPANPLLTTVAERARANRFRVIRQVHFDTRAGNNETIDLVILLNGIPAATVELKTDNTQTIEDAIAQYKRDRVPSKHRPLLSPGRCLVHFAVSNSEVRMATVLAGTNTVFLPFNQGNGERAGNPPCADGSETSYLWRDVLTPASLLQIIQTYAMWQPTNSGGYLVFPRFHQRRAVEKVIGDIETKGQGSRYLIQHSAGSGKTKTIAWLAHRLIRHHTGEDKTFDSVIVISDRQVLDRNLAEEIALLPASRGMVVAVSNKGGAKSEQLGAALSEGGHIITCTVQTFPFVAEQAESMNLSERKWCVIVDEAHSSQHGNASQKLRELLATSTGMSPDEVDESGADDMDVAEEAHVAGVQVSVADQLDQKIAVADDAVARAGNVTFVAFTATPKAKTLRVFGTRTETGGFVAFDHYTMAQAIEEGFILDVLANYTTYSNYVRLAGDVERDETVDKSRVVGEIVRYAKQHPTNIAQKVAVVVNHFQTNVAHLLGGQARAMVVTDSRQSAFHWANEMTKYLAKHELADKFSALVAFSGSLEVDAPRRGKALPGMTTEEIAELDADYDRDLKAREGRFTADGTVTESSYNGVTDTETAFKAEDGSYRVLIVASKFQTGFNEPRLVAMYVDKKLSGVATVQTLSRLNRIHPGKGSPMVVDFANDADKVLADFQRFYTFASLPTDVDPTALLEVSERLDSAGIFTPADLDAVALAVEGDTDGSSGHEMLRALIAPMVTAWNDGIRQARLSGDDEEKQRLLAFRTDLRTYSKAWEFLSQIINFHDPDMRKRAILATYLFRNLRVGLVDIVDVSDVDIIGVAVTPDDKEKNLGLTQGDGELDVPVLGGGTTAATSAVGIAFNEAVDEANAILTAAGVPVSNQAARGFIMQLWGSLAPNDQVVKMAAENTATQLEHAPAFEDALLLALTEAMAASRDMHDLFLGDAVSMAKLKRALAQLVVRGKEQ